MRDERGCVQLGCPRFLRPWRTPKSPLDPLGGLCPRSPAHSAGEVPASLERRGCWKLTQMSCAGILLPRVTPYHTHTRVCPTLNWSDGVVARDHSWRSSAEGWDISFFLLEK